MKTILCILLSAPCLSDADNQRTPDLANGGEAVLSAVHSPELRVIMDRLNRLSYEREYTQLQLDRMRAENIEALVETALQLNRTAERLPDIIKETEFSREESITFQSLARQLYQQTTQLRSDLQRGDYSSLETGYRQLRHTCNACHNLFRDR